MDRHTFTLPAVILSLGLFLSTVVGGFAAYRIKAAQNTISVTGSAQRVITSDAAKWTVTLTRTTGLENVKDGYAQVAADLKSFRDFLKKNQVDDKAVTVAPVMMNARSNGYDSAPIGYQLSQSVTVESADVQKVTKLSQDATSLIAQGALLSTTSLEYYYSKLSDLKVDMMADATKNARERAVKIAESAGGSLGALNDASMGVMQVTAVNSTDVSDYGTYDTSALEKQITAVVRASFSVR